jgi:iron complex outermembrane recepter protein
VNPRLGLVVRATDAQGNGFEPNPSAAVEAGTRLSLGGIDGTVAVFQVKQKNMLVAADASAATQLAIGRARSQGLEVDLHGEVTDDLSLWASYAYVDAKTSDTFNDPNFGVAVPAGTQLLNVPRHMLSLQLGGGLLHVGEHSGEFTTRFTLPAYTVARAFAAYEVSRSTTLRLDVDNLFDQTSYTNSFSALWGQPGAPRSARLSISPDICATKSSASAPRPSRRSGLHTR